MSSHLPTAVPRGYRFRLSAAAGEGLRRNGAMLERDSQRIAQDPMPGAACAQLGRVVDAERDTEPARLARLVYGRAALLELGGRRRARPQTPTRSRADTRGGAMNQEPVAGETRLPRARSATADADELLAFRWLAAQLVRQQRGDQGYAPLVEVAHDGHRGGSLQLVDERIASGAGARDRAVEQHTLERDAHLHKASV
jgi:hypothetical protein